MKKCYPIKMIYEIFSSVMIKYNEWSDLVTVKENGSNFLENRAIRGERHAIQRMARSINR
ncbi:MULTISPECIES: hypothetical protein [Tetragenococcus]|uniref:Uncharacterized protein n=1 Tax=Tetragenococcus solitarius TaxID=71453 RepID=A0ABN3Y1K8_9ENTE|nr:MULTISPECIES: hypothetical protein [Tetragenococcus]MDN6270542.1 hypothetical protein [Tetragenococcus koreensis]MCO8292043.1 hypothetical protein [Tetragenococcus halophilus]MCO8296423.1 hypothetical protein [Tetragenococcus halophilus]MDN6497395.1 hypothetical protein [Tetragenococcus koreensis]MDN6502201.1 hypothetical protein [Tetragenococcus koreensis]